MDDRQLTLIVVPHGDLETRTFAGSTALADDGLAVVFISSELEEVVRQSDRIIVLKDRRKIAEIEGGQGVSAESIVTIIAEDALGDERADAFVREEVTS